MKDDTRLIITAGFALVLLLTLAMVVVSLSQLQSINQTMVLLVNESNAKIQHATTMRDAIRLREISLQKMLNMQDYFEIDAEAQRFTSFGGMYRIAREQLLRLPQHEREVAMHARLLASARAALQVNTQVIDLLLDEAPIEQSRAMVRKAAEFQAALRGILDEMVVLQRTNAAKTLGMVSAGYQRTRLSMWLLGGIVLVLGIVIAGLVIRSSHARTREMAHQASHDALTNLLNRREFERRLGYLVNDAERSSKEHAMLYMDLDQFKVINDTCGHMAGDKLLQQLSTLMLQSVRNRDSLARLGGDEFGLLLEHCPLEMATGIADKMRQLVCDFRFVWKGQQYATGISIGVVAIDSPDLTSAMILSAADSACYAAKGSGRNKIHVYSENDKDIAVMHSQMRWVGKLREALENNQFRLWYQTIAPTYPEDDGKIRMEVLLRLEDDNGELIRPDRFLPAAERYGLMPEVDRWVIRNVFKWMAAHPEFVQRLGMCSINLSGLSLGDRETLNLIMEELRDKELPGNLFCFEVTETAAIANLSHASDFIKTIRSMGCHFALDDFGSGLSSFAYLKKLPVDFLKIDGMFVKDMANDPIDQALVRAIAQIGKVMGMQTVAEFVESAAILEQLQTIGVDYVQGYHIAMPRPLTELEMAENHQPQRSTGGLAG